MIKLDLQMFAKSAAYQREWRKKKTQRIEDEKKEELKEKKEEEKKPEPAKKKQKGEIVTAVKRDEEYEVYRRINGKEEPVRYKNGDIVVRTGVQVMEKFYYDKDREGWISKAGGKRYILRRKR